MNRLTAESTIFACLPKSESIHYFKGFDGLRGIAALLVLFGHSEPILFPNGAGNHPLSVFFFRNGSNAVALFFVLSGFLISYKLLVEIKEKQKIHIGKFYLKRVVRIWPIYYLIILLVQFVLPYLFAGIGKEFKTVSQESFVYYLLILPNVPYLFFDSGKLFHLWSIGIEEQFYLIWAPLMQFFKRNFLALCAGIIVLKWIILYLILPALNLHETGFSILLKQFKLEQMCIGGLGAWYIFSKSADISKLQLFQKPAQLFVYLLLLIYLSYPAKDVDAPLYGLYQFIFVDLGYFLVPTLYLYLLLTVSLNSNTLLKSEGKILNFMGRISYGFYVYHILCLLASELICKTLFQTLPFPVYFVLFYSIAVGLNLIISYLSFEYFEKKFVNLLRKKRV